jgi:hypothetical protein
MPHVGMAKGIEQMGTQIPRSSKAELRHEEIPHHDKQAHYDLGNGTPHLTMMYLLYSTEEWGLWLMLCTL